MEFTTAKKADITRLEKLFFKYFIGGITWITFFILFLFSIGRADTNSYLFPLKDPVKVNGKILCTAWYSYKRADMNGQCYRALNYPCREGSEILCPANGTIIDTGYQRYSGIYIKILFNDGTTFEVNHLSNWNVIKGQKVFRGDIIGYTGRTGRTTGPHLRIVIYKNGEKVFCSASTWGMKYEDFKYHAGSSKEELKFDIL